MSRTYPHLDTLEELRATCRCGARIPLLDAKCTSDSTPARLMWGSDCPAAMRDHIAELERERATAHEAGRRAMCAKMLAFAETGTALDDKTRAAIRFVVSRAAPDLVAAPTPKLAETGDCRTCKEET